MHRPLSLFVLLLAFVIPAHGEDSQLDSVVSVDWLSQHIDDPKLVVLDSTVYFSISPSEGITYQSGLKSFLEGHIPGARFADLIHHLSNQQSTLDNALPTPEAMQKAIQELGISNDSKVVIYSKDNHSWATRVWWMLAWAGHENIAILDGGFAAWEAAGHPVTTEQKSYALGHFTLNLKPDLIADQDAVKAAIDDRDIVIVDALPLPHYEGDFTMYQRPGHIPSAVNVSASMMVNFKREFISSDEVALMLESGPETPVITYCGSGVAASSVAFNLKRAGFKHVAVYMGSLQEWTANPNNPMSTPY